MATKGTISGHLMQYDQPVWAPLVEVVGHRLASSFMWMCEIELADRTRLHAYKHAVTRRYLHLDLAGRAFDYQESGRYREVPVPTAIARAIVGVERSSPTDRDAAALREAVQRARTAS